MFQWVFESKNEHDVSGGQQNGRPQGERGKEENECDCRPEHLRQIGANDGGFGESVERVKNTPSPH